MNSFLTIFPLQVSSNTGFKRAARMKMFDIPMVTHSARALTELKQIELCEMWNVELKTIVNPVLLHNLYMK